MNDIVMRVRDVLWRFRFSIFLSALYLVFEWGFAHLSFTQGFFTSPESPNFGVFAVGGVVFILRFGILFIVPAHVAYRIAETLWLSFGHPKKTR